MIKVVNISNEYKDKYIEMIEEWKNDNHQLVPCIIDFDCNHPIEELNYDNLLSVVQEYNDGVQEDKEYYERSSFYFIVNDDNLVGACELRHNLTELGKNTIGHIACGIRPSERKKGYAKMAVTELLSMMKNEGEDEAIMCHYKENNISERMIKSLGFNFRNSIISKVSGKEIMCYNKKL